MNEDKDGMEANKMKMDRPRERADEDRGTEVGMEVRRQEELERWEGLGL